MAKWPKPLLWKAFVLAYEIYPPMLPTVSGTILFALVAGAVAVEGDATD